MLAKKVRKKSLKSQTKNTKIKIIKFLLKFFVLSLPILLIINLQWYSLEKLITNISSFLLTVVGIDNVMFDTMSLGGNTIPAIYVDGLVVNIDWACTGIRSTYLLFAMLFSFPLNLKKQFKFLGIGTISLFVVNILRIFLVTLLVINFNVPSSFENILWSTTLNITVFAVVLFYLKI